MQKAGCGAGLAELREAETSSLFGGGFDADELAEAATITKLDDAGYACEQGVVLADTYILASLVAGAALTYEDGASGDVLAAEALNAEPLCIRIAAVFR
jgi:hypothetical protein